MAKQTDPAPKYSRGELAANAVAAFGVNPEVVVAAFYMAGVTEATKDEAAAYIDAFLKKEA